MGDHETLVRSSSFGRLRWSLYFGAAFDAAFGLPLVVAPLKLTQAVGVQTSDAVAYRLLGVLLLMIAACYALAGRDPERYVGNLWVAIGGRLLGGVVLLVSFYVAAGVSGQTPMIIAAVGVFDLSLAGLHLWLGRDSLFR